MDKEEGQDSSLMYTDEIGVLVSGAYTDEIGVLVAGANTDKIGELEGKYICYIFWGTELISCYVHRDTENGRTKGQTRKETPVFDSLSTHNLVSPICMVNTTYR